MKRKNFIYVYVLAAVLITGCGRNNAQTPEPSSVPETTTQTTDTSSSTVPSSTENNSTNMISSNEAKAIALEHAGLTEDQVKIIKCELDHDHDEVDYDVEFYTDDQLEYDYEIDAYTGRILGYDLDGHHTAANTPMGDQTDSNAINNGASTDTYITEEEAKKIALDQVPGATEEDFLEFGRDYDDGILLYEVEILYDQKEYEFDIDARDGSILKWDKY